jgi:hypothetical protein
VRLVGDGVDLLAGIGDADGQDRAEA